MDWFRRVLLLCIVVLIARPLVGAGASSEPQVLATHFIEDILRRNGPRIGRLDLKAIAEMLPKVKWVVGSGDTRPAFAGTRRSAYYVENEGRVTIFADLKSVPSEVAQVLSCHEALGALGANEDQYMICIGLWLYRESGALDRGDPTSFFRNYFEMVGRGPTPLRMAEGGSGTSVGGGGDVTALDAKMWTLKALAQNKDFRLNSMIVVAAAAFEPDYDCDHSDFTLKRAQVGRHFVSICVHRWEKADVSRKEEIASMIGNALTSGVGR